jgi:hypothetical protein
MLITKVREDLYERFQEDYKKVKWFLILQNCLIAVTLLLMNLSVLPFTRKYFWWMFSYPVVPVIAFLINIFPLFFESKYNIRERLKGSLYRKWSTVIMVPVALGAMSLFVFFGIIREQSISEAAQEFGKKFQVPTAFPFEVKHSSGTIFFENDELLLHYEDDSHTLDVIIRSNKPAKLGGKTVILNNGNKAWLDTAHDPDFPEDRSLYLDWYHDHLWYSLYLENLNGEFTEQDIINIANSFRDLNISNK